MSNFKYQVIKLNKITKPGVVQLSVPNNTFPLQQYNNIAEYCFYTAPQVNLPNEKPRVDNVTITDFKLSEVEIIARGTPLQPFLCGNSIAFHKKFYEANIPNKATNILLNLTVRGLTLNQSNFYGDVYLILKMNNVKPEQHYKNFYKYESFVATYERNNSDKVSVQFKLKTSASRIVGFFAEPNTQLVGTLNFASPVGRLSLQLNSRKSLPIVAQLYERMLYKQGSLGVTVFSRKTKFFEINEPIINRTFITAFFLSNTPNIHSNTPRFQVNLVFKLQPK